VNCCSYFVCIIIYVCFLYCLCIAVFTLDAGLLATGQNSEGPATGHLDTGFFFFGFTVPKSKCWDGSQNSKLPLHASHLALRT